MATAKFKRTLAIRFLAHLFIFIGGLAVLFQFGPVLGSELGFRKDQVFGFSHSLSPTVITSGGQVQTLPSLSASSGAPSSFGALADVGSTQIQPVSVDFGIVIEKINANSKVIANVDANNTSDYERALSQGVAEAAGSTLPGQPGNLYIFSHSVDAPWNVVRFNAVFYLLRELESGDKVVIFYLGRRYDYIVFDKQIVEPTNTTLLTNRYDKPVLTLQTCDPPGTLLHRLIVRAKLAGT